MCEQYHCEDGGWLPVDGVTDRIDYHDGAAAMELLWPTEWTRCFCADSDNLPEGVDV
jgi:hypothetical protein